jgi:hypothetical protein
MKNIFILLTFILSSIESSSVLASCPASIVGGYVGYQTKVSLNTTNNVITNISNSVFVINIDKKNVKVTTSIHVSADSAEGLQVDEINPMSYSYDKATCTARFWETSVGTSKADFFFVVGNNGTILNGVQQDVWDNESKLFVITKQ